MGKGITSLRKSKIRNILLVRQKYLKRVALEASMSAASTSELPPSPSPSVESAPTNEVSVMKTRSATRTRDAPDAGTSIDSPGVNATGSSFVVSGDLTVRDFPTLYAPGSSASEINSQSFGTFRNGDRHGSKNIKDMQYITIQKNVIQDLLKGVVCGLCYGTRMVVDYEHRLLAVGVTVKCEDCEKCLYEERKSDSDLKTQFVTNMLVYVAMLLGFGFSGLQRLCAYLSMKCLPEKNYTKIVDTITDKAVEKARVILRHSVGAVFRYYKEVLRRLPGEDGVLDVDVLFEGSWPKSGHFGIGVVMEAHTGLILDYQVLSKHCQACNSMEAKMQKNDIIPDEFAQWQADHESECTRNYNGPVDNMEPAAAMCLWKRSLGKKLRYVSLIANGNSLPFETVAQMNSGSGPYESKKFEKVDCVSLVLRRLGNGLRNLQQDLTKERRNANTIGERDRSFEHTTLSSDTLANLVKYFDVSVRQENCSVQQMKYDVLSSFFHCSSTDETPRHHLCPKSPNSWCFYQKAIAKEEVPPSHKTIQEQFITDWSLREKVLSVYKQLSSDELVIAYLRGKALYPTNDSFHSRIWRYCPKPSDANKRTVDFAAAHVVSSHNAGFEASHLDTILGLPRTALSVSYLVRQDEKREAPLKKLTSVWNEKDRMDVDSDSGTDPTSQSGWQTK